MMAEAILRSDSLIVGYGSTHVISGIDLGAEAGKILTLIGPNGAGKSTILKTLIKQLPPVSGTVYLDGKELNTLKPRDIALKVSAVLTGRPNPELMTCADVVATGRYPYTGRLGVLSPADRDAVADVMALVHVTELSGRDFSRVSDGQRQRVMLARAVCQEPDVLLLDEPTSFLDVRYRVDFLTTLRALAREKRIAVVMSLHELDCAERISDTVLCVRAGAVDRVGRPEEVFTGDYIEALYGMEPGSYRAFFGGAGDRRFFQNRACESFPCHGGVDEADFNCLFCFCPLYALGERCGGSFHYTEKGVKSCVDCAFPHRRENYERVLARWPELSALAKGKDHGV